MPLGWNEIRHRAIQFAHTWAGAKSERAEKQTFWNEFFDVFGIRRRTVASFEAPVKGISGEYGFIDLFWRGVLLVEHKSRGQKLGKAESQAFRYIQDLMSAGRDDEVPRYVIVSDFARIALHDLEPDEPGEAPREGESRVSTLEFPLKELHKHIHAFAFIPGYKQHKFEDQDPINIKAVGIIGGLHDALSTGGYEGHALERFLVRVLFCLFAEDTGIFERDSFSLFIENNTKEDGSDLDVHLALLFDILNTPAEKRQANLDETLASFPYVNGDLFAENLGFAAFNMDMRNALMACTRFDWSRISPAVFGSLFQAIMEPKERRQIGGHYTSERDILKVIRSLFLDDLREEFERAKRNKAELKRFHQKLASLRFLDPACGCGNFLVISYREVRQLEVEVLREIHSEWFRGDFHAVLDAQQLSQLDVDAFYGIEIQEWPARIAEVAMWLMDHQMNIKLSETFGQYYVRLPLRKSPTIVCDNALHLDWKTVLPPDKCSYVLGNPPFVGAKEKTAKQRSDMDSVWGKTKAHGILDYVTAWYHRAAEYIRGTSIKVGYVSTNSITQGEQVSVLWDTLYKQFGVHICFAHRTFPWTSEARGKAHVHVVIVGFASFDTGNRRQLFDYPEPENPKMNIVGNINPYLVEGMNLTIPTRGHPISPDAPKMLKGSEATDDGQLVLTEEERGALLHDFPEVAPHIRLYTGGKEFINSTPRWCLWLVDAKSKLIKSCPPIMERLAAVRKFRLASPKQRTIGLAEFPALFGEVRQPDSEYLLVPKVSSERRKYLPIGFLPPNVIANGSALVVPEASLYHFGVISSAAHMAWMRQICGRMKSDYQYSVSIVYNNFPWPEAPSKKQRDSVEACAEEILDLRVSLGDGRSGFLRSSRSRGIRASLADLYDPLCMPSDLVKAHQSLDRAVDRCYRSQPFSSERQRVEFLFALYEKITAPLVPQEKRRRNPG